MSKKSLSDKITNSLTLGSTICFIIFVILLIGSLLWNSSASIKKFGLSFISNSNWNVRFLEFSRVLIRDNSFVVYFTVPINDSNIEQLVHINQNRNNIPYSYTATNTTLILSPSIPIEQNTYSISFSSNITDRQKNSLGQDITWTGTVSEKNLLINTKAEGSLSGKIETVITNDNERHFGILPFIIGTIVSSLLALLLAFPIALATALFLTEYSHPKSRFAKIFTILIDLLAGIPSVIYGLWGLFFLVPLLGANIGTASLILAIMILPYAVSLTREAISLVPNKLKLAGFGLGASHYKVIQKIILPYSQSGIIAGILLTLGRALGETLAVTMVIGNRNQIPTSLSDPAQTIASLIANEYGEASGLKQSALIESGFILVIITLLFSLLGRFFIRYANKKNEVSE